MHLLPSSLEAFSTWRSTGHTRLCSFRQLLLLRMVWRLPHFPPLWCTHSVSVAHEIFTTFADDLVVWYGRDIVRRFNLKLKDQSDVHSRLMQAYPEVPTWWYGAVGVISFLLLILGVEIFPTQLPVWAALIAFLIAAIVSVPVAMLQALSNISVPLQVMHELVAGYMLPGRPVANMIFKTIAFMGTNQGVGFAGDLKLGHYMKIPPRIMFIIQTVAVVVASVVAITVQDLMFAHVQDICTPDQPSRFVCPSIRTFATASIIWGGVGPARLFSPGQLYSPLLWFFLVGAALPIPFFMLSRRFPRSSFRYVNIPVFFSGVGAIPPGTGINYASWAIVGFVFNYFIRRFHFRWWMRYNYLLSAGLDAGVAIGMVCLFFLVHLPTRGFTFNWVSCCA